MLTKKISNLLKDREFISVATCNFEGRPNAAPKFVLKVDPANVYLVDYTIGTTFHNLTINPRASLSFVDPSTLTAYQLNGPVRIIDRGPEYKKMREEMLDKQIRLTAKHLIEDVRGQAKHDSYEVGITEKYVIFKVQVEEMVEIGREGSLRRIRKARR